MGKIMNSGFTDRIKNTIFEKMLLMAWRGIYANHIKIGIIGFFMLVFGSFMNFVPIIDKTWRSGSSGLVVTLSCLLGCLLLNKRRFFSCFFIAMFAAFFLILEIIIIYDNHAIELGKEFGPDGVFRLFFQIFSHALTPAAGAFWGFLGSLLALSGILIGWSADVVEKNNEAALSSSVEDEACDSSDDNYLQES